MNDKENYIIIHQAALSRSGLDDLSKIINNPFGLYDLSDLYKICLNQGWGCSFNVDLSQKDKNRKRSIKSIKIIL